jgi:MacB-like periplasmic core domain
LGTQPVLGRGFAPEDDVDGTGWGLPGRNAVAVIGYGLWQQVFGGDRKALGATIRIDGNPLTVIGVAPPGFDYPGKAVLWKPAAFSPGNNGWGTIARLKPGVTWPQARAAFAVEVERLSPKLEETDYSNLRPSMTSLQDGLAGPVKNASLMFMCAVVLVLGICAAAGSDWHLWHRFLCRGSEDSRNGCTDGPGYDAGPPSRHAVAAGLADGCSRSHPRNSRSTVTGRFLESLIDRAKSIDIVTSIGVVLFLALVASTSIWSATRRIARIDISAILRTE